MAFIGNQNSSEDCVIHQLSELFGNTLDMEVIKRVAVTCKYDVMESSNRLVEMTTMTEDKNFIGRSKDKSYCTALASGTSPMSLSNSSSCTTISSNNKSRKAMDFERCVNSINEGYKVMILLRGLPGSGKTTLAKKILEYTVGYDANYTLHILSTDDYFCQNPRGIYEYDKRKIDIAHNWNQSRAFQATSRGFSPVIIDNTNTQIWELKAYATMAIDYGYILEILEPDTHWCFNDRELAKRNTHGVPRNKLKELVTRYEKNITAKKLLSAYKLHYQFQKPPQMRLYPPLHVSKNVTNGTVNEQPVLAAETINLMNFDDVEDDSQKNIHSKCNGNDIFDISSDDENEASNKDDLYAQWGVNENTLKSWDIVTPLQDIFTNDSATLQLSNMDCSKVETLEAAVCTEDEYFRLVKNEDILPGLYGNIKIVETVNRDINFLTPRREPNISLKLTLDKSCVTDDLYEDYASHLAELENLFPSIPKNHLSYWYNKCKGDLEWTIEFLLEAKDEVISLIEEDEAVVDEDAENNEKDVEMTDGNDLSPKPEIPFKKKPRKTCDADKSQEEKRQIKKMLESKFDIGGEHYSQHLRRIKQYKLRNKRTDDTSLPSTSEVPNTETESDISVMKIEDVITIDSDVEFDDNSSEISVVQETIELNLGETFISQLEAKFADPNIKYPKGLLPVVQMPVNLAKQLYTFYIESVYQQMENQNQILNTLIKEDEEFARKLQAKEQEELDAYKPPPVPNLKEIMVDQRKAQNAYQTEIEKWKNFNLDTLADKLTKQKLIKMFPTIPENDLLEIFNAHDNDYKDTVETIIACMGMENVKSSEDIKEPPIKVHTLNEMKEAQKKHSCERRSEERLSAEVYREEANKYLKKRTNLYQRAQKYYQAGMTEVAQFYSGLASLQTIYYDRANNMAATTFLDEHSKRLQDFSTLDLHFLYVKEAIPALDMFLDTNINLLRMSTTKNSEYLQIITGRGKRSENGISKIKPAVITRLNKRGIKYVQLNPGLLKVKIGKTSSVTSEIV